MNKKKGIMEWITVRASASVGLILLLIVAILAGRGALFQMERRADSVMKVLQQQCASFNRLVAADRTKSLFRLSEVVGELRQELKQSPELATDEHLEAFVDRMYLTGVALLDGNLQLEASGHTRQFRGQDWLFDQNAEHLSDAMTYPTKIYLERVEADGEYYDVCVMARLDAPGLLTAFYRQPSGVVDSIYRDMESLMSGLQLEGDGHYVVVEDGVVRANSDSSLSGAQDSEQALLRQLSQLVKDERLHTFYADGRAYLGYRSGCENYSIYIYYPVSTVSASTVSTLVVFVMIYCVLSLIYFSVRNRTLSENQTALEKSNADLQETVRMLKALETIYFSLFYVDLREDSYSTIYAADWLRPAVGDRGRYTELKRMFLNTMAVQAYREELERKMSISFIREALSRENLTDIRKSFYTDYQGTRGTTVRWCRNTVTVVDFDDDGKPKHVLALIQDVDKEKKKEAEYQTQILKEAHDAKVANNAKTEFLRRISHDIRTPLNGIQGCIEMSAAHPEDALLQSRCREKALVSLHTLMELVNSVLDMSKLESSELVLAEEKFSLSALLDEVDIIIQPQAEARGIRYEVLRTGTLPVDSVIGSPRHLTQVLMNLVSNAVKYGTPGGFIRLNTRLMTSDDKTVTYEFRCQDDGLGMSPEFQTHMYEPFAQEGNGARTTYEGTGLGLSIVKKLVDAMGGTITCQSERGVGTTFCVRLTLRRAAKPEPVRVNEKAKTSLAGIRILLVEDNELNMEIAETFLTEDGANVTKAWNGREAVEAFAASPEGYFDLILMDIMMPEMDGLEATKAIRQLGRKDAKTVPISAMSANAFSDDVQRSREAGMNGHISKPVDEQKLLRLAAELVKRKE